MGRRGPRAAKGRGPATYLTNKLLGLLERGPFSPVRHERLDNLVRLDVARVGGDLKHLPDPATSRVTDE